MNQYELVYMHYENCFARHGDSHRGVDWPDANHAALRYKVMTDIITQKPCTLLDFGCGLSHLYEFIIDAGLNDAVQYTGLDISKIFVNESKKKYPENTYIQKDCLQESLDAHFDYIIMNGVFTEKRELTYAEMFDFFSALFLQIYPCANRAIAFNVMSKQVDWERDDLFHLPMDTLSWFLHTNGMRNFIIRNDYGLYEYTVYVYKEANI